MCETKQCYFSTEIIWTFMTYCMLEKKLDM